MALTPKQERFVAEYLVDLNATAAAMRAGYKEKTAAQEGYKLLQKPSVADAIQEERANLSKRTEITQDMVIEELAKIAFANGTMYAKVAGGNVVLTETDELTEDQKAAVSGIKEGKFGIEVSTYDKVKALELIGKYLGIFEARTQKGNDGGNPLTAILKSTEGDMDTDEIPEAQ